jgi:hypothetical protein
LQPNLLALALLWRNALPESPYFQNAGLRAWILAALRATIARQHGNGAFDSIAPFTQDHGVTLAFAYYLSETARLLGDELPAGLKQSVHDCVRRACDFAWHSREDYAFISNHHALFALGWHGAGELLFDSRLIKRAEESVNQILQHQSTEGWYAEYGGFDPGYESLGIHYLALYHQRTGSTRLLDSLRRSVRFFWHFVHPDGSVGGVYGSRHTSLYFPGGFEVLAAEIPEAAAVADFMRERLALGNVVTPATTDAHNLAPLMASYLTAALALAPRQGVPSLPCQTLQGVHRFEDSGITVAGTARYYAVVHAAKGGVCRIFDKQAEKIAYEDAGYLAQTPEGPWISQRLGLGRAIPSANARQVDCQAQFAAYLPLLPTPWRFVLLRILNLTLFRSQSVGARIRNWLVRQLIASVRPRPLRLRRSMLFEADAVIVDDTLEAARPMQVTEVTLPRALTGIHMGSAKYFHPSELVETPQAQVGHLARDLNRTGRAECRFTLKFLPAGGVELLAGAIDSPSDDLEAASHRL